MGVSYFWGLATGASMHHPWTETSARSGVGALLFAEGLAMNPPHSIRTGALASGARIRRLIAGLIAATLVFGCSGKTSDELATEALASGLTAQASGDLELASTSYLACLEHDSMNSFCLYNLGVIAQQQDRLAEAENDYRLALVSDPSFGAAIFNLAILRTQAGAPDEAISLYRHFLELEPASATGFLNLGLLLRATGDTVNANRSLTQALALDPTLKIPAGSPAPTPTPTPTVAPTSSPTASSTGLD
jgi:tetratricopeptide (TPR) repeat protein